MNIVTKIGSKILIKCVLFLETSLINPKRLTLFRVLAVDVVSCSNEIVQGIRNCLQLLARF